MRALSLILAFAFVLAAPAWDVSAAQDNLPGVGTFNYSGSPIITGTPATVLVASR